MTYRPPAISVALDLVDKAYDAALDLARAGYNYGHDDTAANEEARNIADDALDVACTKLVEHLTRMARSEQVAS